MNLYIQLSNGTPIGHPIVEENFLHAFPDVDVTNLPDNFARFEATEPPEITPYQKLLDPEYKEINGVYTHVWTVVDFTSEEKQEFRDSAKALCKHSSWIFDETLYTMVPPCGYPAPDDPNRYTWNEELVRWDVIIDV